MSNQDRTILMSNQDKIFFLKRLFICTKEIERLTEYIEKLKSARDKITQNFSISPMSKNGGYDKSKIVDEIIDLEDDVLKKISEWIELKKEIEGLIETVDDEKLKLLLKYRYINNMTFEQIAVRMDMSWRQTHRNHSAALEKIKNFNMA